MLSVPLLALVPDHAPVAEQDVALVAFQLMVDVPPLATLVGNAESDTDGGGLPMLTVVLAEPLPFAFEQVRPKVEFADSGPTD